MSSPQVPEIHRDRRVAESFGGDAERYDRTRPAYPDALVQRVIAASPGRHVLDAGCGTGIEARQFRAAGCRVLGVEPDARMAEFARTYTREEWLDQLPTQGHLNLLPPDKLAQVLDSVGAAIDAMGGSFTMPYATVAVTAKRVRAEHGGTDDPR